MGSIAVVVVLGVIAAVLHAPALPRRRALGRALPPPAAHARGDPRASHGAATARGAPRSGRRRGRFPASAVPGLGLVDRAPHRVRTSPSSRPVPPPPVANPAEPLTFDDAEPATRCPADLHDAGTRTRSSTPSTTGPRRLGGPAAAVGAVLVLILVLILTGLHSDDAEAPRQVGHRRDTTHATTHPRTSTSTTTTTTTDDHDHGAARRSRRRRRRRPTRPPTRWPRPPTRSTIAATTGECWVEVTEHRDGHGALHRRRCSPGQSHTIAATGPVTVIAGAPGCVRRHRQRRARDAAAGQSGAVHPQLLDAAAVDDRAVDDADSSLGPAASARPRASSRKA